MRMWRCTLTFVVMLATILVASLTVVSADALNGGLKQTDFPKLGVYLQIIDPGTGLPLMVKGPDGNPIECSPLQTPMDATLRVIWLPNPGSRLTERIKNREKDGIAEPDLVGGPYVVDYDVSSDWIGPHLIKGVIWTSEGRWDPKAEVYNVIPLKVAQARFAPITIAAQTSPQPDDPLMGLSTPAVEQTFFCAYDKVNRVQLEDQVMVRMNGRVVGLLEVTHLDRFGYNAKLIAGEAPPGAELYFLNNGGGR